MIGWYRKLWTSAWLAAGIVLAGAGAGCASPSAANIELRKQNAELSSRIAHLNRQHEADLATIRGIQDRTGVLATLPPERMAKLFTVGSMKLTKQTGGANLEHEEGPDTGVKAYVRLFDTTGDLIKQAGTFTVEVFDLADSQHPLVAKKTFPVEQADSLWYPMPLVYAFVLPVPWADGQPPKHDEVTVKVTYVDELTQRVFTEQTVAKVKLGPSTRPATTASAWRS